MPFRSSCLQTASPRAFCRPSLLSAPQHLGWAPHAKMHGAEEVPGPRCSLPLAAQTAGPFLTHRSVRSRSALPARLPRSPYLETRVWANVEPCAASKRDERVFTPRTLLEPFRSGLPGSTGRGEGWAGAGGPRRLAEQPAPGFTPHPGSERGCVSSALHPSASGPSRPKRLATVLL